MFAFLDDGIQELDLDWADAPRRISHDLGPKRPRPAVTEKEPPDNLGPEVWARVLSHLPVPARLTFLRSNTDGSARLFRLNDEAADYLAS